MMRTVLADGSVDVPFGGCDGKIPNCLPTMPGRNYMVRLYCPERRLYKAGGRRRSLLVRSATGTQPTLRRSVQTSANDP